MNTSRRRKFTDSEKQSIVEDAHKRGINVVLYEHKLSYSVFSRWKQKFLPGEAKELRTVTAISQQLKELVTENEHLKRIVANQALEIQIKNEKLKEALAGLQRYQ